MGKLGKKSRKFAKKNLQSVYKRKRKLKAFFKRKSTKNGYHELEVAEEQQIVPATKRSPGENVEGISIETVFGENDSQKLSDDSGSDGYLSEDSSAEVVTEIEKNEYPEDDSSSTQAQEVLQELQTKKQKLQRLKKKDPEFCKFVESFEINCRFFRNDDDYSDEDEPPKENGDLDPLKHRLINVSLTHSWCQLVSEQQSIPALTSLLNGFRAACHYGDKQSSSIDGNVVYEMQDNETCGQILLFLLQNADTIFREMLGIALSTCKKEVVLALKDSSRWKDVRPLVKSYLRSTICLLCQFTDSDLLAFVLSRIRASLIFFSAFPNLLQRLIKSTVHLWMTSEGSLSMQSFLIVKDVAVIFSSDCFEICLVQTYKAFVGHSQFMEPVSPKHMQFLRNSLVELWSQDMQKSYSKVALSIQYLAKMLQLGLETKDKEVMKKIHGWQYISCIDLWVTFVSENIRDHDLQPLQYALIQIISGVAQLFPGARYLPLRVKCIQWLNYLSRSSGMFIPVTSLVLDILEYKTGKEGAKPGKEPVASTTIKLPKSWLKSRGFQEYCFFCVSELLAAHFDQWSCHISFPELAMIPIMRLRKFSQTIAAENLRRLVKRFIEQVEKNVEFVRRKRDEASFSPKDYQSVETFQLEKFDGQCPFTQYYQSVIEKAASRNPTVSRNIKLSGKKHKKAIGFQA